MPVPSSRDHADVRARLEEWLGGHLPQPTVSELTIPQASGFSSETLLFDATWAGGGRGSFVARLQPADTDVPVFPEYDLELQYRCLNLVREHTAVPVPVARWFEPETEPLGSPFFVMDRVDGVVPPDMMPYTFEGWLYDADPADRARLQDRTMAVLVELHAIDATAVDLAFLDRPEHGSSALDQHLGYQRWYYDWARDGEIYPVLEATFEWLAANRPDRPDEPGLNWGDARIGNVIYVDFEPVAVLDWEMAALGPPEVDLAWGLFMHSFFATAAEVMGIAPLDDFYRRADVVAQYEAHSGRTVRDLEFFEMLAALRYGIIAARLHRRQVAIGEAEPAATPDDAIMTSTLTYSMLDGSYWDQ